MSFPPLRKVRRHCRLSLSRTQMGALFLLRLRCVRLAIALVLLRGRLWLLIRSGGLGGFILTALLLIRHSISLRENRFQ